MNKTKKDDLLALIDAMDKNEKRYFTLYASSKHVKNGLAHLEFFKTLQQKGGHDAVQAKGKKASETRSALFKFILQVMGTYHRNKDLALQVQSLIQEARYLRGKGLYEKCVKWLEKAEKLANENELLVEGLKVQEEMRLLIKERTNKNRGEILERSWISTKESLQAMQTEYQLRETLDKVFDIGRREFRLRTGEQIDLVDQLLEGENLAVDAQLPTVKAMFWHHQIHSMSHQLRGEFEKAYGWSVKAHDIWRSHPNQSKSRGQGYLLCMASMLQNSFVAQRYDRIEEILHELKSFQPNSYNEEAEWFQNYYFYQFLVLMNQENFKAAINLSGEITSGLKKYQSKINEARLISFQYNLGMAYFLEGEYTNALLWYREITEAQETENRMDLQQMVRIFSLICHLEAGDLQLCESLFRSAYRHLKRRRRLHEFEKELLALLKKTIYATNDEQRRQTTDEMKSLCQDFGQEGKRSAPIGMAELQWWLQKRAHQLSNHNQ